MKKFLQIFGILMVMILTVSCNKETETQLEKENYEQPTIAKRKQKAHVHFMCDEHGEEHNVYLLDGTLFHNWGRWEPPTLKTNWYLCTEHKENHIRILQNGRVFDDIGKDEIDPEDI